MHYLSKGQLMIYCGVLYDIAEKTNDRNVKRQLKDIASKMEIILCNDNVIKAEMKTELTK